MLSTENPSPDPSCLNCEISQLKSGDEAKGSDSKNCQLNEVDLLDQSSVVDDKNPLPNFSIRDYVFSKRRKDIKTNWPFSQKALQLCLRCDVKDVLPPFQSLDSVKNPSLVKSVDEHISSYSPDQNVDPKLAVDTENIDSTRSEKETESKISLGKKSEFAVPLVEIENPKPVKKCKLVVNSSNISEPKSNEGVSLTGNLNHCGVSETTMASKVCPVCKTFSSSSNTTLNAHIDQCLSGESMENSKSIKHRIKPRKMRLMVDIYSTALSCTLEDLDKRNGTNWAWNLGFNAQDLEIYAEEKENEMSSGNVEKCNEESAVYIDSNGTKVRILSKFNDLPSSSTAKDDNGPKKIAKKDKTSKVLCSKKKKYVVDKDNVSKCPPEVKNGEQREVSIEENLTQPHRTRDQIRSDDLGMIKQWVSSKRTVLRKKMNLQHKKQDKTVKNSGSKSNIVSLDKFMKRTNDTNSSILCDDENPRKRKDNLSSNAHDELSSPRKMVGFSLPTQNLQGNKNHFVKKLRKDGPLIRDRCDDPSNEIENHVSPNFKKISQKFSSDGPCISLRMPHEPLFSSKGEEFASTKKSSLEGNKFSSLKKNLLSGKSKNLGRKCLDFKKPKLQYALRSDVEAIDFGFARRYNLVETPSKNVQKGVGESLIDRSSFSKIRKRKRQFMSKRQESSDTSESDNNETGASLDATKDVELACEPTSRIADGEAFTTFSKSLSPPFPAVVNPSDVECARHFTKPYEENDPPELNLSGEQDIFSIGKVGKYMVSQNTDFMTEMDGNEGNGNYLVDVEPIPIPGPPGSFLPSPGRMGSEELPGSSSLTTCKILSSEDEHELVVDMHSSDSSQTSSSMVSSFVPARRPDPVPFMKFSAKSQFIQNESQCDIVEGKLKLDESRSNFMLHETANLRLKNDQPCCSRKEGVLQSGPLNYHDSQFLRQQTMTSLAVEKNVVYSSMGFAPECVSLNSEANFQACEPPSPLSPNPVLRLMGKNLMVVNKDENLQANVENGGNMHNNAHHSFHPPFFETVQRRIPAQHFDFSSSHGFKVPTVCVQLSPHPSTVMFSSKSSSLERNLMPDQLMSNIPGEFSGQKNHNDVTVLDDLPENEPFLANKSAFCDVNMEHGGSSAQIAWGYDSRHVNPLYSYPTMGYPLCSGSRIPNANSQVLHNGKNANLAEWIYAPETSNPLTASSPSTGFGGVKPMTGPVSSVGYSHSLFSIRQ